MVEPLGDHDFSEDEKTELKERGLEQKGYDGIASLAALATCAGAYTHGHNLKLALNLRQGQTINMYIWNVAFFGLNIGCVLTYLRDYKNHQKEYQNYLAVKY